MRVRARARVRGRRDVQEGLVVDARRRRGGWNRRKPPEEAKHQGRKEGRGRPRKRKYTASSLVSAAELTPPSRASLAVSFLTLPFFLSFPKCVRIVPDVAVLLEVVPSVLLRAALAQPRQLEVTPLGHLLPRRQLVTHSNLPGWLAGCLPA